MNVAGILLRGGLAIGAVAFASVIVGSQGFEGLVTHDVHELFSQNVQAGASESRRPLPEPVLRHLRYAVPGGTPAIRTVRMLHGGTFRTKPDAAWWPIEGEEYFTLGRPGFVWAARAEPSALVWIGVRDRLIDGRGNMLVKAYSTLTMIDAEGAQIDQGSRTRWLAEMMWCPTALAGDAMRWEPIDAHSARATLLDEGLPVSLVFEFDGEGKISGMHGERYYDAGDGKPKLAPWFGRARDYREFDGVRVPTTAEVGWMLQGKEFIYARFRVTALETNVAERFR